MENQELCGIPQKGTIARLEWLCRKYGAQNLVVDTYHLPGKIIIRYKMRNSEVAAHLESVLEENRPLGIMLRFEREPGFWRKGWNQLRGR
jgi:hypothetical protein